MKTKFKGHETFFFREGWLTKALFALKKEKHQTTLFSGNNAIGVLGVGANMTKAIKYWLLSSGLIEFKSNKYYALSELGDIVADYDPNLEDMFSLWLLHVKIVRNFENATSWNLFFNEFGAEAFRSADVKNVLKVHMEQKEIPFSEKTFESDIDVLLNMYSKGADTVDPEENFSCPLSRLGLINRNGNNFTKTMPSLDDVHDQIVFYAIYLLIKDKGEENTAISIDELENGKNSLKNLFSFNRVIINEYLDQLAVQGKIRLEKTAGLDMVYLTTKDSATEIVKKYYEGSVNL